MASQETRYNISELKSSDRHPGEKFSAVFLIRKISVRTARNNNPFLQVEFGDRTGSFNHVCFNDNAAYEALQTAREGQAVAITGEVDYYQGRFSPRIGEISFLTEEELSEPGLLDNLVDKSPEDAGELTAELKRFTANIRHPGIRATVEAAFEEYGDAFRESSAAISMHHAYRHGLLEHTVHMARVCEKIAPLYPEVHADLAMAGILLHDIGKTVEYGGNLAVKKTRAGILQGHVVLGYRAVRKAGIRAKLDPALLERLEHIVLSHQGELEWGAAAMAATPEAVFVSMIDNLDAKMGTVQNAVRKAAAGEEFSEYLPALQTNLLLEPVPETTRPETAPGPTPGDPASPPSETEAESPRPPDTAELFDR